MQKLFFFALLLTNSTFSLSQSLTGLEVVTKSIEYHDPDNMLYEQDLSFYFTEKRPDGSASKTSVRLAPKTERFSITSRKNSVEKHTAIHGQNVKFYLDGKLETDENILKENKLVAEKAFRIKNYYLYLWHLPVKLLDPGTIISPIVKETKFDKHNVYEVKVTYDSTVGSDTWYFYFDMKNFALSGYRFYHDESKNDGEYIVLENEYVHDLIRLPKKRKWYTHKEDKYLGTDILDRIELNTSPE